MSETSSLSTAVDVDFTTSPRFTDFLNAQRLSLVLSTYQTGTLFFFGPAGRHCH